MQAACDTPIARVTGCIYPLVVVVVVVVVVFLTLTRAIKSVVTGQASVTLEWKKYHRERKKKKKKREPEWHTPPSTGWYIPEGQQDDVKYPG